MHDGACVRRDTVALSVVTNGELRVNSSSINLYATNGFNFDLSHSNDIAVNYRPACDEPAAYHKLRVFARLCTVFFIGGHHIRPQSKDINDELKVD